ncbi:MAG: S41 family peptidase [Candidatus Omnitrophota bacterium]|nr:S41 family peptidase [Candidatus Omnitrophota bacterium]
MLKRLKIPLLALALILTTSLVMGGYDAQKAGKAQSKDDLYSQIELFSDAISAIRSDYVTEVDSKKMIYGSLKGMLSSLDDFSAFLDPDEYKEISVETKGEFGGIGVEIVLRDGIITIITPIAGTPADSAGLKPQDKIVRINGKTTKNITLNDAVKMMRGEPGTSLTLTIWREKEEKVLDVPIKRAVINVTSVKDAYLLEDKIGYIRLIEFQQKAARELEDNLKKLEGQGMDALILDLRNNPGGLLDSAIEISEKFLPKDHTIVSTKSKNQSQNTIFKSKGQSQHPQYPIIVLVNEGSASASEIVAGALRDNKRAILLGAKTFGKGSVQTVIPLKDGSALRLTTASYYTPSGKSIMNEGVAPDVVVEQEELKDKKKSPTDIFEKIEEDKDVKKVGKTGKPKEIIERDNQLQSALNLLKAIKVYKAQS